MLHPHAVRRHDALWLGAALLALALLVALRLVVIGDVHAQIAIGWPTPPPGPRFVPPSSEAVAADARVPVALQGGEVVLVRPSWPGTIPLVPPIPSTAVRFTRGTGGPPLDLRIDAGTYAEGIQLRVTPRDPPATTDGTALWAFDLAAFDLDARLIAEPPQRPIRLQIPTGAFTAAGLEGKHLLFATLVDEELRWIVTEFDAARQVLTTRLAQLGTVVLVNDTP